MAGKTRKRRKDDRTGAAVVELAVTLPVLVLLFVGMTEFGSIFFTRHSMILAAREGARQMAVEGSTEDDAKTVVESHLARSGITNVTVTTENAYKGNGDDAEARQVNVQVEIPVSDASILGDMLNIFAPDSTISVDVSMRKEGELVSAPTS